MFVPDDDARDGLEGFLWRLLHAPKAHFDDHCLSELLRMLRFPALLRLRATRLQDVSTAFECHKRNL